MDIKCPECKSENIEELEYNFDLYIPNCYCRCCYCKQEFVVDYIPNKITKAEDL